MDETTFSATVLHKLPLADATWRLLHFSLDAGWLQDLWQAFRGRCYERQLGFPLLAHLVAEALVQHGGSGRQSFERAREDGSLPVALSSVFAKLGRVPLAVSEGLLEQGSQRLHALVPNTGAVQAPPDGWADHDLYAVDGKAVKHVKRLLKPLRGLQAGILGARAAVGLNLRTGQAVALAGHLDGEAGEAALAERLLPRLAQASGGRPWVVVLDRLYCNLTFPPRVRAAGGHFVVRYDPHTRFTPDCQRPAQQHRDADGQAVVQRWGWLGSATDRRLYVREITRHDATGATICIVTDLLDEARFPAADLLALYRQRWGIERVFHQITDVFALKNLIGTSPHAVLFQLAFCLLLYNTLQVVRAHIARGQAVAADTVSTEKLFYDVKRQLISVQELVTVPRLLAALGPVPTSEALRGWLQERLGPVWSRRWKKAPSSGGGGHQRVKTRVLGNHTSTYRELQKALPGTSPPAAGP